MTVFNVEQEEHASRIARKEIGQRLENIPLKVLSVDVIEDEGADGEDQDERPADDPAASDDDLLPEFEDLVEEQ
jgi:hypothetical protein